MLYSDYKKECLKDPEFARKYEEAKQEVDMMVAVLDARKQRNLTQEELARRSGVHQSDISKIENGTRNPSIKMLRKIARGLNMKLEIKFVPNVQA